MIHIVVMESKIQMVQIVSDTLLRSMEARIKMKVTQTLISIGNALIFLILFSILDSYLARLNYTKKSPQFKPYTGRDYEQFKKNYGFGTGHLAVDYDSTTYKEKVDRMLSHCDIYLCLLCFTDRKTS
jgi:hypothetical protein